MNMSFCASSYIKSCIHDVRNAFYFNLNMYPSVAHYRHSARSREIIGLAAAEYVAYAEVVTSFKR